MLNAKFIPSHASITGWSRHFSFLFFWKNLKSDIRDQNEQTLQFCCNKTLAYHKPSCCMRTTKNQFFVIVFSPLFVTWHIGKDKRLRGCIGTFSAMNLHSGKIDEPWDRFTLSFSQNVSKLLCPFRSSWIRLNQCIEGYPLFTNSSGRISKIDCLCLNFAGNFHGNVWRADVSEQFFNPKNCNFWFRDLKMPRTFWIGP